jgi:hypothetical protein
MAVDPHAFKRLWPALGIWLVLFLAAGDGWVLLRRQAALRFGRPARAIVVSAGRRREAAFGARKNVVTFDCEGSRSSEPVGSRGFSSIKPGRRLPAHVLPRVGAFLDDDLGYSRWKLGLFSAAFLALWAWAAARYRFG